MIIPAEIQRRKLPGNFLGCLAWADGFGVRDKDTVADAALRASPRRFLSDVIFDFFEW